MITISLYKKQKELIKKKILDTSITIFKEKGYDNATIDEITKTVGIAKGTFYNFYSSKREILIQWAADKLQQLELEQEMDSYKHLEENLNRFIELITESMEGEEELFHCFLKEILQNHGDKNYGIQFDLLTIYKFIIMNSNDFKAISEASLDDKVEVINSILFMGIVNWFDRGKPLEGLREHLKNLINICMYGLLNN